MSEFEKMFRSNGDPPTFGGGSTVPVATYLLTIVVLSGLILVSPSASPPPLLGTAWGVFLVALALGASKIEGVDPRSIFPSVRTLVPVVVTLGAFWAAYNLLAVGFAVGGVPGFEMTPSSAAAHPVRYLAVLLGSVLFTAIPEESLFRAYLQEKFVSLAGGGSRRAVVTGIGVATVLFALFHLPRWFLASGHGIGTSLAARLLGLVLVGLTYGIAYALTGNLWLVALFHATMNHPPFLVTVSYPPDLHLFVGVVESAAIVAVVYAAVRLVDPEGAALGGFQRGTSSAPGE
jgi:membrane protease YdiL (CAAX protease family)